MVLKNSRDMTFVWYHGFLIGAVIAVILAIGYGLLRYQLWEFFETCSYTRPRRMDQEERVQLRNDHQVVLISHTAMK